MRAKRPPLPNIARRALALGCLLAGLAGAAPAGAQPFLGIDDDRGSVRGWRIGLSRALGGCLASGTFRDNTTVWIGFERVNNSAFIALTNPNWASIEQGRTYRLTLSADGRRWTGDFLGIQREGQVGLITTGLRSEFVVDFARANGIQATFEGRSVARLSLAGSLAAVQEVLSCQQREAAASPPGAASPGRQAAGQTPRERESISTGTGFFVSLAGHVLTNQHVVRTCSNTIFVRPPGGELQRASVLAADGPNDLALLRTEIRPTAVPTLTTATRVGESIYVYGFPLTGTLTATGNFTVGHITAAAGPDDNSRLFQHSAPTQPGNSGGPMIDQYGNISGVIVSTLRQTDSHVPQNVNFAIKSSAAITFLETNSIARPQLPATVPLDAPTIAERARDFTVLVICR